MKVFAKVKNGQKKCPIPENPKTILKSEFLKSDLDHNANNPDFFIENVLP